jgi:superfamily II DNA or RNA helicase
VILLDTPTTARLIGYEDKIQDLEKTLTFTDKTVDFELNRLKRGEAYWVGRMGKEAYDKSLEELKKKRKRSLLFTDEQGLYTHSGLSWRVGKKFGDQVKREYDTPSTKMLPWSKEPRFKDRNYQVEAHDLLIEAAQHGPAGVELATGAGKSTIIRNIIKTMGRPTLVMAPSKSIAYQLFDDLTQAFGKKYVGLYGDGKKEFKKLICVGIDDSLARVEPGSEAWEAHSKRTLFIADESHLCPARTLAKVCFDLMAKAPYRLFFSATQMRNDGADLLLEGIVGNIVMRKTVHELVDEGYLSKPIFKMVRCQSSSFYDSGEASLMTRKHLFYNKRVLELAGDMANKFVDVMKRPTLILVKEVEQFGRLLPFLKHAARFAHGPLNADNKDGVPVEYHKDKPEDLVAMFNEGKLPILVGTSCIATGTDIRVAEAGIYLMGGKSEIEVRQGVGRETRGGTEGTVLNPWTGKPKHNSIHVDFSVENVELLRYHAKARAAVYEDLYGPVSYVDRMDGPLA